MTDPAWILLVLAAAVADWVAVWRRPSRAENVLKPAVLVLLLAVAVVLDPFDGAQRAWFVAALVLSLAGDVFLLPAVDAFVPGLASFLLAHVAYVVGFWQVDRSVSARTPVLVALALGLLTVASRVVPSVARRDRTLVGPVVLYIAVIASMVVSAVARGTGIALAGAVLFAVSDSFLAIDRFVRSRPWMPLAVMVTYHVAQALLVVSLVS